MTDRTDRWLLLVIALIGVALLVPAVSAHGTNQSDWTDWMQTTWGGDAPDDLGPHAQARGHGPHGGHYGPGYGPADGEYANESRYGPHVHRHGPHVQGQYHGADANGTYYPGPPTENDTYDTGNGTYYTSDRHANDTTYRGAGTDGERRYRGGPGGCH
ncbi:hypothetical protein HSBGL_1318 [Halapricum desulfuricans]|uniref:Uncharacterized protein n=1 Tax=Halapricum desulfuricans TaxID=2841257 RepID=A0A897NBE9_9EURY|nr:hypothetical protein [Halapricum desulfuricans]QSG11740.1 hypothetical protein HSBGL_1318 [Halapricum desulfuricans]